MKLTTELLARNYVFSSGYVAARGQLAFLAHYEPALNEGVALAQVFFREGENWREAARFKWGGVGLVAWPGTTTRAVVLGRDGEVGLTESGGTEEHLDMDGVVGPTRGICVIAEDVLAFGMNREVFRRIGEGRWRAWDKGMQPPLVPGESFEEEMDRLDENPGGINAIVGNSLDNMYAFGIRGEIWRNEGEAWRAVDSPTNLALNAATMTAKGEIFACGQCGVILKGVGDQWGMVNYEGEQGLDFCGIAAFRDRIFLADGHSLRALDADSLEVVDFSVGGEIVPSSALHANDGILLSVAGKEIFTTMDGESWASLLA